MSTFIPNIFPLLPFFHVDLHQTVVQQYPIDSIMRDMDPVCFLNLLLQMDWTNGVGLIGFEDQLFCSIIDGLELSSRLPEYRIFPRFSELVDELIHSLTGNLEIPGNLNNGFLICPLLNDPLDIPIR